MILTKENLREFDPRSAEVYRVPVPASAGKWILVSGILLLLAGGACTVLLWNVLLRGAIGLGATVAVCGIVCLAYASRVGPGSIYFEIGPSSLKYVCRRTSWEIPWKEMTRLVVMHDQIFHGKARAIGLAVRTLTPAEKLPVESVQVFAGARSEFLPFTHFAGYVLSPKEVLPLLQARWAAATGNPALEMEHSVR